LLNREYILGRIFKKDYIEDMTLEVALEDAEFDIAISFTDEEELESMITLIGIRMLKLIEDYC